MQLIHYVQYCAFYTVFKKKNKLNNLIHKIKPEKKIETWSNVSECVWSDLVSCSMFLPETASCTVRVPDLMFNDPTQTLTQTLMIKAVGH